MQYFNRVTKPKAITKLGHTTIANANSTKDLGVIVDDHLSLMCISITLLLVLMGCLTLYTNVLFPRILQL